MHRSRGVSYLEIDNDEIVMYVCMYVLYSSISIKILTNPFCKSINPPTSTVLLHYGTFFVILLYLVLSLIHLHLKDS